MVEQVAQVVAAVGDVDLRRAEVARREAVAARQFRQEFGRFRLDLHQALRARRGGPRFEFRLRVDHRRDQRRVEVLRRRPVRGSRSRRSAAVRRSRGARSRPSPRPRPRARSRRARPACASAAAWPSSSLRPGPHLPSLSSTADILICPAHPARPTTPAPAPPRCRRSPRHTSPAPPSPPGSAGAPRALR